MLNSCLCAQLLPFFNENICPAENWVRMPAPEHIQRKLGDVWIHEVTIPAGMLASCFLQK